MKKPAPAPARPPAPPNYPPTDLPDQLRAGVEALSGHSLADVRVHHNSARPAQLQAHAYAQGTAIEVVSGQEKHLPHEAWHVVRQPRGRVRPATQPCAGAAINDAPALEQAADAMGAQAICNAAAGKARPGQSNPRGQRQ